MTGVTTRSGMRASVWPAYLAGVLAFLYAGVSFYWALGGTAGLDTIGGSLEQLGRNRNPSIITLVWVTGFLKLLAGLLALALVMPWGRIIPRLLLLIAGWSGGALLALYGGLFVVGGMLVMIGVIPASETANWTALQWHLFLWDPWFLLWGLSLGLATFQYQRR